MTLRFGSRRLPARGVALAALLGACALTPAAAVAMSASATDPELSPRLAELARPEVRSASRAEQAARIGLPVSGPGSLLRDGSRVLVDVRFERGAVAGLDALREAGAEIVHVSRRYQTVTVRRRPARPARASARVTRRRRCHRGADAAAPRRRLRRQRPLRGRHPAERRECPRRLRRRRQRRHRRRPLRLLRPRPVRRHARRGGRASGDLPGPGSPCGSTAPVNVLDDSESDGSDEGRAMAQIVHDLAPGASI